VGKPRLLPISVLLMGTGLFLTIIAIYLPVISEVEISIIIRKTIKTALSKVSFLTSIPPKHLISLFYTNHTCHANEGYNKTGII
jgi:hypothetical protein